MFVCLYVTSRNFKINGKEAKELCYTSIYKEIPSHISSKLV